MATVSLTNYDSQIAELQRRQRMAQALQEQALQQPEVLTYKGIAARPSTLGILANALKAYAGARGERKSVEDTGLLNKLAREEAAARGSSYTPAEEPAMVPIAPVPAAAAPQTLAAALGGQPVMDTQSGASRAAGIPSNPLAVAAPPPAAPPPGMVPNTQSGASIAMGMGPNPNAAPMPMPPAAPSPAPAGAMAPINVQPPRPAGSSAAQIQEALNRATSDLSSSNLFVREQARNAIPGLNQLLGRQQQVADRDEGRAYAQSQSDQTKQYAKELGQSLLASIPNGTPPAVRLAVEAHVRVGDLDGAAKVLGDAISGPGGKMHVNFDSVTGRWVVAQENPNGALSNISHYDAFSQGNASQPLSPEQAASLPAGTEFVGLDGVRRVKH